MPLYQRFVKLAIYLCAAFSVFVFAFHLSSLEISSQKTANKNSQNQNQISQDSEPTEQNFLIESFYSIGNEPVIADLGSIDQKAPLSESKSIASIGNPELSNLNYFLQEAFKDCSECKDPFTVNDKSQNVKVKRTRNILEQLLDPHSVKPKLDMFRLYTNPRKEFLDDHCDTCAMVTNSGFLLDSNAGTEIDSKRCVFRMNDGPVTGYEADVGSRTTHR